MYRLVARIPLNHYFFEESPKRTEITEQVRWGAAENSGESKVQGMIEEIRCNEETKHESEKAKKKTLENSQ
jgi:hypothetical protein